MIGAIAAGVALVIGKMQGRKEASETILKSPVPTVPTSKVTTPPTWSDHKALVDRVNRTEADILRVESELKDMRHIEAEHFRQLMSAGEERMDRINTKIDGFARAMHARIDELLTPKRTR